MGKTIEINGDSTSLCRRCGTCCRRGGPALHLQDKALVTAGAIPIERLYTIRAGERVRDDVAGGVLVAADGELVKIRDAPGSRACFFFDPNSAGCRIYAQRPLECRALRCWDDGEIRRIYRRERLGRRDLIGHVAGLWDLVTEHDRRCSAGLLFDLADRRRTGVDSARVDARMCRMVAYDEALRRQLDESGRVCAAVFDFLLGRPLSVLLRSMGIAVNRRASGSAAEPRPQAWDPPV